MKRFGESFIISSWIARVSPSVQVSNISSVSVVIILAYTSIRVKRGLDEMTVASPLLTFAIQDAVTE